MTEKPQEALDCPHCGMINEPTSQYCECGFNLKGGIREKRIAWSARRTRVLKHALRGGFICAAGIAITVFTLEHAPGGVTFIAYGAIAVGAFDLLLGLSEFIRLLAEQRRAKNG